MTKRGLRIFDRIELLALATLSLQSPLGLTRRSMLACRTHCPAALASVARMERSGMRDQDE